MASLVHRMPSPCLCEARFSTWKAPFDSHSSDVYFRFNHVRANDTLRTYLSGIKYFNFRFQADFSFSFPPASKGKSCVWMFFSDRKDTACNQTLHFNKFSLDMNINLFQGTTYIIYKNTTKSSLHLKWNPQNDSKALAVPE